MNAEIPPAPTFATLHPNLLIGIHRALSRLAERGQTSGGSLFPFGPYGEAFEVTAI